MNKAKQRLERQQGARLDNLVKSFALLLSYHP